MLYQKKNNALEPLTGSTLYAETPIGTVIASFLAVAPSGYIKADGTVYTKAAYPELYERIPDVFKDTTNETFTIDLREVALKGIGLSSLTSNHYSSTGLTLGEFIEDRNKNHRHQLTRTVYQYGYTTTDGFNHTGSGNFSYSNSGGQDNQVSYEGGATAEVKSVGVNYFVKAKHVALPIDIMDAISEEYVSKDRVPDYSVQLNTQSVTSFTCPKDCVVNYRAVWIRYGNVQTISDYEKLDSFVIKVNGNIVGNTDHSTFGTGSSATHIWLQSLSLQLKAGDVITSDRTDGSTDIPTLTVNALRVYGYVGE